MQYASAVIGLGQIGQGYDYDRRDGSVIVTHANAFVRHEKYALIAGVDPEEKKRQRFEEKFDRPAYSDVETLFSQHHLDVISIAVPTMQHCEVFEKVMQHRPLAVICEKPIALSTVDGFRMTNLAKETECALLVNYIRRFDPGVILAQQAIRDGEIGRIYKGTVWYSKGLLNNGSHFIDLLLFLIGKADEIEILHPGRKWDGRDPEPDVRIRFNGVDIYFLAVREECFSMNRMELIGTLGELDYEDGGHRIEIRSAQPHPVLAGYRSLAPNGRLISNDMKRCQWHVLDHLERHLTEKSPLNSNGDSAVETLAIVERVVSKL